MRTGVSFAPLPIVLVVLVGCASGAGPVELQGRLNDLPGVGSAVAGSVGDDDLPFGEPAVYASVEMGPDATADQVADVLDVLEDVTLETAEIRMTGSKPALLVVSSTDLGANDQLAEELVEAYLDPNVCSYYRDPQGTDIRHCDD